jgi:hypothetical protein
MHISGRLKIQRLDLWSILDSGPPPSVLLLTEGGGGGPECILKIAHRSAVEKEMCKSTVHGVFWTPLANMPLTVGGVLEWNFSLVGPLSIRGMNPLVPNPTTYYCLT